MKYVTVPICLLTLVASAAHAAPASRKASSSVGAVRAACLKQVGAYYRPAEGRWYYAATGRGSPQEQAFYACLDRAMMKR